MTTPAPSSRGQTPSNHEVDTNHNQVGEINNDIEITRTSLENHARDETPNQTHSPTNNETTGTTEDDPIINPPLSWREAREYMLRQVLLKWEKRGKDRSTSSPMCRLDDLDMLASLLLSGLLLSLGILSLKRSPGSNSSAINLGLTSGGAFAVLSSLLSIALSLIRRNASRSNQNAGLKRSVRSHASFLSRLIENTKKNDGGSNSNNVGIQLSGGTSLTDIYPAYRRTRTGGGWNRIPTLLLVKGDYVALQVGDMAPATVELLDVSNAERISARMEGGKNEGMKKVIIPGGERVTMQCFEGHDNAMSASSLAHGKNTLSPESRELLFLCNGMKIFVLRETPLHGILQRDHAEHKPPQIHRQARAIRCALCIASTVTFVITTALIFARQPNLLSNNNQSHPFITLSLPLLAALGALPLTTPIILFFLEVFGTSRILTAIHPHTSRQQQHCSDTVDASPKNLFYNYCTSTIRSRLTPQTNSSPLPLNNIPPADSYLLEKLGVATALTLIDDELACEVYSTPQQLLIPTGHGMKLLDLCPTMEDDGGEDMSEFDSLYRRKRGASGGNGINGGGGASSDDSDSDSAEEEQDMHRRSATKRTLASLTRRYRRKRSGSEVQQQLHLKHSFRKKSEEMDVEVQFEDPLWWHYLASLKCIGLACLLVDGKREVKIEKRLSLGSMVRTLSSVSIASSTQSQPPPPQPELLRKTSDLMDIEEDQSNQNQNLHSLLSPSGSAAAAESSLINHICRDRTRNQLLLLAQCIGFQTDDLTPFRERRRLHIISTPLLLDRMAIDTHALGLEESREWGMLRPDCTSVIIQDKRSKAYQLLTVGDARVMTDLCTDSWQGDNSTITPLSKTDRQMILDTSNNWYLADLDVSAFSYAPVPYTLEQRMGGGGGAGGTAYLVDNPSQPPDASSSTPKETTGDWSLLTHQIFLGVLGSSVSPRKEIALIIEQCTAAGVRFVYFSPRNMRRTKELASQMGIDVAWNCAISLRSLDEGEEDPHRMTSSYADWDVNARLPHGIESVKRHLEQVDNVPLLVSLYTDVTESTTAEMVNIFQKYHDTAIAIGLSHRSRNERTFTTADLSIGVDILNKELYPESGKQANDSNSTMTEDKSSTTAKPINLPTTSTESLFPPEVQFVSSIASHSCVFNLRGSSAMAHLPEIIAHGRLALEATSSAALFAIQGGLCLTALVLLCPMSASKSIPIVPVLGSVLYILVLIPILGLAMATTDADRDCMNRVPPKNDESIAFARGEGRRLYIHAIVRSFPPAIASHLLYYITFGALVSAFERPLVESQCRGGMSWSSAIRCDALQTYTGPAKTSAGALLLANMTLCVVILSAGFVNRTQPLVKEPPWVKNRAWSWSVASSVVLLVVYLGVTLETGTMKALPWYYFALSLILPFVCLGISEGVKLKDRFHEDRAVRLRRLQFETRLGMWSPK